MIISAEETEKEIDNPSYPSDRNILSFFHQYTDKKYILSILSYLHPKDLLIIHQLSHEYSSINSPVMDIIWKECCIQRWLASRQTVSNGLCLKRDSLPSWKITYKVWQHEMKIPHGKFMPISQRVFGKYRGKGLDCWFYLKHSNDCLLHSSEKYPNSVIGNIRLCIQNTFLNTIQFHLLTSFQFYLKGEPCTPLPVINSQLSSKNGIEEKSPINELVTLQYLEYAVITLQILCPSGMSNEVDLLSSLDRIDGRGWRSSCIHDRHHKSKFLFFETQGESFMDNIDDSDKGELSTLTVQVVEEDKVWNAYQSAPGGVILLKELSQVMIGN